MRIYSAPDEETLRARAFLKEWADDGLITGEQRQRMEQDTGCDLRRTNIFLRVVLFLFTLIIVGAAAGLFFVVFFERAASRTAGFFLLIFAVLSYAGAEIAAGKVGLFRYGIEEALAVCSVIFLSLGIGSMTQFGAVVVPAAGALLSLWIWQRFGLAYMFLAAMVFAIFLPSHWTSSYPAQHVIVAALYLIGLAVVAAVRSRHRLDYLNVGYSLVEAFLWLGIYAAVNLQFPSLQRLGFWWGVPGSNVEFGTAFYWGTWIAIWILPAAILVRAVHSKDKWVLAAGLLAATLTLITNQPYLGWPRHTWDPMLLGILLIVVALFVRRWLAAGGGGVRRGFTAERLSSKDQRWLSGASSVIGIAGPQSIAPHPQASTPGVQFGGGDSGGGGATSDF